MRIAEIFRSIQGEGLLTGVESIFVRASGCNLRCIFCDTRYASWDPIGADASIDEILAQVTRHQVPYVVITGGEPMLFAELIPLCERLHELERHVTIETAGTLYLPVCCDLMSISPKLSNSTPPAEDFLQWRIRHDRDRVAPEVVRRLIHEHPYQLKFVIENARDLGEVREYISLMPEVDARFVMCMPQATTPVGLAHFEEWLPAACTDEGWQYCPRRHINWFGCVPGT